MANEFAVLIIAEGELPASQRAECPTKPCASTPETPAIGAADVDVVGEVEVEVEVSSEAVVGAVVVTVVVDAGGAASGLCGCDPVPPPVNTIAAASPAANANI